MYSVSPVSYTVYQCWIECAALKVGTLCYARAQSFLSAVVQTRSNNKPAPHCSELNNHASSDRSAALISNRYSRSAMTSTAVPSRPVYEFSRAPRGRPFVAPSMPIGPPAGNAGPRRTPHEPPQQSQQRPSEMTLAEARVEQARARFEAFTAGPVAAMRRDMAQRAARQSLCRAGDLEATRSSGPLIHVPSILPPVEEEKSHSSGWQHDLPHGVPSHSLTRAISVVEEKKESAISTVRTVLHHDEIEQLKLYHDNSLAVSTRRAYQSDHDSFVQFLRDRFPRLDIERMQTECTLEHVLSYLNALCEESKTISTVNRRLSSIKRHILPGLFIKATVPGSRDEQMLREVEAIIKGIRRTVGAEHRIRGKQPLLIENVREMVNVAAEAVDGDGKAMPNKRCRDMALLLFLWHSAMRRNEVVRLRWTDLTFDKRGVVVLIRQSKTDKESKGQTIAIPRLEGAHCCVTALEAWRENSSGVGESPVLSWISKKDEIQWRELIDQRIVAILKAYCEEVGLDSRFFACHSTRSGYTTSCSDRGVPISEIMKRTRHKAISSVQAYMKSDDLFNNSGDRLL